MNIQKIIKDHNLALRKLPLTRPRWRRKWYDNDTRYEIKFYEAPIKNGGCWICGIFHSHTPAIYWSVETDYHHPDPTLEGCLTKFILATYPNDEAKQAEYL
jgi:hypothetical protein